MAVAYVQEFTIVDGDTSTANYDAVFKALNLDQAPDGLIVHTAGFDHDKGVFRIFDVWESRDAGAAIHRRAAHPDPGAVHGERSQRASSRRPAPTTGTTCTTR